MSVDLIYYASKGNIEKIKKCIQKGVCVDAHSGNGETALYQASKNGFRKCVRYLLKRGADPNSCSEQGYTPLNAACFDDHLTCLALLVEHGGIVHRLVPGCKETPLETAVRCRSKKCKKFIKILMEDALTKDGENLLELNVQETEVPSQNKHKILCRNPGMLARIPCIEPQELKLLQRDSHRENGPDWLLQSAIWRGIPVTVKRELPEGEKKYNKHLLKEIDVLSQLRHPRLAILMAANVGPVAEYIFLVLEPFELGSLHYMLYETQLKMNLAERVEIFVDVAEGMIFLHNNKLLHCFLNSYSVLISEKYRAKIGNLEYTQENGNQRSALNRNEVQLRWLAPEQFSLEPANTAADVYSFGATMWECLTRTEPWDWIEKDLIRHFVCKLRRRLPLLETWPDYIQTVIGRCLERPELRPKFTFLYEQLYSVKNRGWDLTSDDLDNSFITWLEDHNFKRHSMQRKSSTVQKFNDLLNKKDIIDDILEENYIPFRRHSSVTEKTITEGLRKVLKITYSHYEKKQEKQDASKFGNTVAAQMSTIRRIRSHAERYNRHRWAKEVTLARSLGGDMKRLQQTIEEKKARKVKKYKPLLTKCEVRRLRMEPDKVSRIQSLAAKFDKKRWARHLDKLTCISEVEAKRKKSVDTQINLFKKRSCLVQTSSITESSEEYESESLDVSSSLSSLQELSDQHSFTVSDNDSSIEKTEINKTERQPVSVTRTKSYTSCVNNPQVHVPFIRSKSLDDLKWKACNDLSTRTTVNQKEDTQQRSVSLLCNRSSKVSVTEATPKSSKKGHLATNTSSALRPQKPHSASSGTTSKDSTTSHASISVPDVLTPVEISPSLKSSTFSSNNAKKTMKLLEDFSSWLDNAVSSEDSDEEQKGLPNFAKPKSVDCSPKQSIFENSRTGTDTREGNTAYEMENEDQTSKNASQTMLELSATGKIHSDADESRWIFTNKDTKNILKFASVRKISRNHPRKIKSLESFLDKHINSHPTGEQSTEQRKQMTKNFSFEHQIPSNTDERISVELKVKVQPSSKLFRKQSW